MVMILLALPAQLVAGGYSEYENHQIWLLRLSARSYASNFAKHECSWIPSTRTSFSDEFSVGDDVADERLLWNIMSMLRLDQNARDLAVAFDNERGSAYWKTMEVDADNLVELKKIFELHGFPTPDQIGDVGVNAMLMLVAHADRDLNFQRSVVQSMDDQVAKGTLPAMYPAVLKSIRPQITGAPETVTVDETPYVPKATYKNGQDCYDVKYRESYYGYLRRHYTAAD